MVKALRCVLHQGLFGSAGAPHARGLDQPGNFSSQQHNRLSGSGVETVAGVESVGAVAAKRGPGGRNLRRACGFVCHVLNVTCTNARAGLREVRATRNATGESPIACPRRAKSKPLSAVA